MIQNYFKTAFRHIRKNRTYLFINAVGLGIAMGMCIVAYVIYKYNKDFDSNHVNRDRIYRVNTIKSGTQEFFGVAPAPLEILLPGQVGGVEAAFSLDSWGLTVNAGERTFRENIHFASNELLSWLTFPLLQGHSDPSNPSNILLSERAVRKYFGQEEALGKTITIYADDSRKKDLVISGIIEDPVWNSSFLIDFITSPDNQIDAAGNRLESEDWSNWKDAIFVVTNPGGQKTQIESAMDVFVEPHNSARQDFETMAYRLDPLPEMASKARDLRWNALNNALPPSMVWGNIVMAILLLLTACLNFANMTVSLSGQRLKEIGVRKVMGSTQKQLIAQLFTESFTVCLIALALGVAMSSWFINLYNQQWFFLDLELAILKDPILSVFLIGTVVVTTLIAGAYPAFYISSFQPNAIFQGAVRFGGPSIVSRLLLGTQIAISLVAIVAGFSFARNAYYQENADLGFQRTGIQAVFTGDTEGFRIMSNVAQNHPKIMASAGARFHIGDSCPRVEFELRGEDFETEYMTIGRDYMELMNIDVVKGRGFNYEMETDYRETIVVNEKFADQFFQGQEVIGQSVVFFDTLECRIVGVVENFMQDSFFDPLRPLALKLAKDDRQQYLAIRSEPEDALAVRDYLLSEWRLHYPMKPFSHFFQNEFLAEAMGISNNIKWTMMVFAFITILLTISGLFALISLNIMKRMKEIAVRRVLGANVMEISTLLNRKFLWIVVLGIALGCGAGAFLSIKLLGSIFNVHSGISFILTVSAGLLVMLIIALTFAFKIREVMHSNPAHVLASE